MAINGERFNKVSVVAGMVLVLSAAPMMTACTVTFEDAPSSSQSSSTLEQESDSEESERVTADDQKSSNETSTASEQSSAQDEQAATEEVNDGEYRAIDEFIRQFNEQSDYKISGMKVVENIDDR